MAAMRLTEEDLAARTLARQFPSVPGQGAAAVLELFRRLGPIQSQVPRAPFLTAASRLPGTDYATVQSLFAEHLLLKTSTLRGTVHTSVREHHPWLDAVARRGRSGVLRSQLKLQRVSAEQLVAELERYAEDGWRSRSELVAHGRAWLAEHESADSAAVVSSTLSESLLWGHSGLLRRPKDDRWERRTDIYHRTARALVPELPTSSFDDALRSLVRVHLAALGPATRQDLAYFLGAGLRAVDTAVRELGDEVVQLRGPGEDTYLDLAEPPPGEPADPGVRLLPEFDALLVGYHLRHRTRFLTAEQLGQVWARVNGQFAPTVLHHGLLVGLCRTVGHGARVDLEITPFPGFAPPP